MVGKTLLADENTEPIEMDLFKRCELPWHRLEEARAGVWLNTLK